MSRLDHAPRAQDGGPLLLIEQEPLAPAGHVEEWLADRGIAHRRVTASAGEPLPDPAGFAGVIALGSRRSANDDDVPWVRQELDLLRRAVDTSRPVLGICFGGQALARVLGARVTRASRPELGWLHVGSRHPQLIADGPWFTWHGDVFDLPPGATLLAHNSHSLQAFAWGRHLGLQFHPEVTPEIIAAWLALAVEQGAVDDAGAILRSTPDLAARARANAFQLFDFWLSGSGPDAAPAAPAGGS